MASVEAAGQGDMAVHFIDVGQGLAILVQSAGENLLYDGGDRSHANEVVEYLKNQQVDTIDYMISSHYDEDHLGGLVKCLDNFEVEHILGSDYVHTSEHVSYTHLHKYDISTSVQVLLPECGIPRNFHHKSCSFLLPASR